MSTNINISVGDNKLLDQARLQQTASRQAQLEKEANKRLSNEAEINRVNALAAQGKDANGNTITAPGTTPKPLRDEPAAQRLATGSLYFLQPTAPTSSVNTSNYTYYNYKAQTKGFSSDTQIYGIAYNLSNNNSLIFNGHEYSANGGPNNSPAHILKSQNGTTGGGGVTNGVESWMWQVSGPSHDPPIYTRLQSGSKLAKLQDCTLEFFIKVGDRPRSANTHFYYVQLDMLGDPINFLRNYAGITLRLDFQTFNAPSAGESQWLTEIDVTIQPNSTDPDATRYAYRDYGGNAGSNQTDSVILESESQQLSTNTRGVPLGATSFNKITQFRDVETNFFPVSWAAWTHFAFVKKGPNLYCFANGVKYLTVEVANEWQLYYTYNGTKMYPSIETYMVVYSFAGLFQGLESTSQTISFHGLRFEDKAIYPTTGFTPPPNL